MNLRPLPCEGSALPLSYPPRSCNLNIMIILSQTDSEKTRNPSVALAFINKQMARVYLKAAGALIWAFADGTHLRYF